MKPRKPVIAVVGPCAAGKSTLINALKEHGYHAHHVAQEHSHVPDMWKVVRKPDILVYLDISYEVSKARQSIRFLPRGIYQNQVDRLKHAFEHADLIIRTDHLSPPEILDQVLEFLDTHLA